MQQMNLNEFIEMSKYAGMREDLVQAGGGNSSYKSAENRMVVKASGYQMSDITAERGYAVVDPQVIAAAFCENDDVDSMTEERSKEILEQALIEGERPSIEIFLHAVSAEYTLHTHPITVNALACRPDGADRLHELFPEALWLPYAAPGVELAKAYFKAYRENGKGTGIAFLQNHGLLVSGESAEMVIQMTEQVVKKTADYLSVDYKRYYNASKLYQILGYGIVWTVTDKNVLDAYHAFGSLWEHAVCPDCVVFLGRKMFEAGDGFDRRRLEEFAAAYGKPVIFSYKGALYISAKSVKKALEMQSVLSFSAQVMSINKGCACHMLTDSQQDFLLNWEAERFRVQI